ncbi:MAG: hypothetical protein IT367_20140, partial [Candidatus Hydrogenedentes bacterium]|nr:hypothetical protein [Candidatus Hydrogenedentota bacterium]
VSNNLQELGEKVLANPSLEAFNTVYMPFLTMVMDYNSETMRMIERNNPIAIDSDIKRDTLWTWRYLLGSGIGLGLILMFFGFIQWYRKLQRYQDMIVKKEASDPEKPWLTP